ncbi:MAG: diguanylate cyclase, partial [Sulfuricurvum sp.]|uniref:diguanylate cyclase domain-containing protein n=1 Tax=Sulfuricurvum sp. TaxID=2025608 RepID=UPI0027357C05
RSLIESQVFEDAGHITCSIGITEVSEEDSLHSAIERADGALYAAKDMGRNRTIACDASPL